MSSRSQLWARGPGCVATAGSGNVHRVISRAFRSRRTTLAGLTAVLCAAALGLTACGSDKSSGSSTPSPSASVSASSSASVSASASASASTSPTKPATTITSLDAITVKGAAGKAPTVTAKWPIKIAKTTSKVLIAGSGRAVDADATVNVNYVGIDARTGKTFDSSFSRGQAASFSLSQVVPGFQKGLQGHKVGERVLVMMPGSDAYDSQGGNSTAGILTGDSLVFVVDILDTSYAAASGTPVTPAAGLPTVTVKNNVPTVTIGKAVKPTKLVAQTLIKGAGRPVTAKDIVQVKYRTWAWSTGSLIEDGYSGTGVTGQMSGVIEGWKKGLAGQTVGSRVMLIVPPDQAYPNGNATPSIDKGETLIYVVDILFADASS